MPKFIEVPKKVKDAQKRIARDQKIVDDFNATLPGYADEVLRGLRSDITIVDGKAHWRFDEQQADPIHKTVSPRAVVRAVELRGL